MDSDGVRGPRSSHASRHTSGSSTNAGAPLSGPLQEALDQARRLTEALEDCLPVASLEMGAAGARIAELEKSLATAESDNRNLAMLLATTEQQAARLMNLYVASYQLHATLDPAEVQQAIAEITLNLLGSDSFVLLLRKDRAGGCQVMMAEGLTEEMGGFSAGQTYHGGDPMVDACLGEGRLLIGPMAGSEAVAAVPLVVQGATVGALVLLHLLPHRSELGNEDRDLLDLIGAHAASALFSARLHVVVKRKLRTLEGLMKLVRG